MTRGRWDPGNPRHVRIVRPDVRVFHSLVVVSAVLTATCGASPTTPTPTEANQIVIADPADRLAAFRTELTTVLEQALVRAVQALPLTGVTITVAPDPARAIGGYGVGGFTTDGRSVALYIDPSHAGLAAVLTPRVSLMLSHEWHHAARFRGPGYGRTLLEAMVSEGLADHFAVDLLRAEAPPWSRALPTTEIAAWLDRARPLFDSTTYGHERWFFGSTPPVPLWTGYTLGYHLVEWYRETHPGTTALTLVNTSAAAFRR